MEDLRLTTAVADERMCKKCGGSVEDPEDLEGGLWCGCAEACICGECGESVNTPEDLEGGLWCGCSVEV